MILPLLFLLYNQHCMCRFKPFVFIVLKEMLNPNSVCFNYSPVFMREIGK